MLLALWFDFWNSADWIPAPPPAPPQDMGAGSGGHQGKHEYVPYSEAYWELREAMLLRHAPRPVPKEAPEPVKELVIERNKLVASVKRKPKVPNLALLREQEAKILAFDEKINRIALQIEEIEVDSRDEDAIVAILLC
jgi:hypothetical protein